MWGDPWLPDYSNSYISTPELGYLDKPFVNFFLYWYYELGLGFGKGPLLPTVYFSYSKPCYSFFTCERFFVLGRGRP